MNYFELYSKAEDAYFQQKYVLAINLFKKAYSLNPSNSNLNYIACCYIGVRNYGCAKKLLKSLIQTSHWETPWYNLGRVYLKENDFPKALQCFREAMSINCENDSCHFYFGVYSQSLHKYAEAITYYQKAIELCDSKEDISMYLNNMALCYYHINDKSRANLLLNQSLICNPLNEDAIYNKRLLKEM